MMPEIKNIEASLIELEEPSDLLMAKGEDGLLHIYMSTTLVLAVASDAMDEDTFNQFRRDLSHVELGVLHGEEAVDIAIKAIELDTAFGR